MRDSIRNIQEMGQSVRQFALAHGDQFAANSRATDLFTRLNTALASLDQHATAQTSGQHSAQQSTTTKADARRELRADIDAIAETARSMSIETPGLADKFRIPRGGLSDQELLTLARAFLADAAPYKTDFIANEMPADFLEDLQADITAFESSGSGQKVGKQTHVSATDGLSEAADELLNLVKQLNAPIRNKFRDQPTILAAWESAQHTKRLPRPKDKDKQNKPDTPPQPPPKP
jgi:hypothetical protein